MKQYEMTENNKNFKKEDCSEDIMGKMFYPKAKIHQFSLWFIYAAPLWDMVNVQSNSLLKCDKFVMSTDGL